MRAEEQDAEERERREQKEKEKIKKEEEEKERRKNLYKRELIQYALLFHVIVVKRVLPFNIITLLCPWFD